MGDATIRFYVITENKIVRVGVDSQNKRRLLPLSGKTALLLELIYLKTVPLSLFRSSLALIEFDTLGRWSLSPVEEQRAIRKINQAWDNSSENVPFIPGPRINKAQKALLKERIVKDFDIYFWNSLREKLPVYRR